MNSDLEQYQKHHQGIMESARLNQCEKENEEENDVVVYNHDESSSDDEEEWCASDSESEGGYDTDDPERWGPYYWSDEQIKKDAIISTKAKDYAKFAAFKTMRKLNFAGQVLVHFFGLHNNSYQWVVDVVEREKRREEEQKLYQRQREELEEQHRVDKYNAKESAQLELLETGETT